MNYIRHLTGAFTRFAEDNRLTPYHISLYMALFQIWNLHRFVNPLMISRSEIMWLAKIGSVNTYSRCIKQLHEWGYINYKPSYNPHRGSQITFIRFDTGSSTGTEQLSEQVVRPYINYRNNENQKNQINKASEQPVSDLIQAENRSSTEDDNESDKKAEYIKREKSCAKKEKNFQAPTLDKVLQFFRSQNYLELEARKFFHYFNSVGWKVGNNKPMEDWQSAAHNWMLNAGTINQHNNHKNGNNTRNHLHTKKDKNYGEPL